MYLPLLRGKQFELIALREISDLISGDDFAISPIIEPVKSSFITFRKSLQVFLDKDVNCMSSEEFRQKYIKNKKEI
jgi:hypothetical protein